MIRSDITYEPPVGPYTVRKAGERWLVVRQIAGVDAASVVADCRTEQAARSLADEFNGLRARYEGVRV
jgi:aminoglycoside phosphotransferase